ncbi:S41 family peptidase [Tessaracoccus caeni]|uniref:S41 family peptidase n=1 Tax=Tessaracoccus caeni TaxID=3031239 RepID=UPI0023DC8017|nr:S41 family peptidase [Tessaracoccus caeni]MDF1487843.1 S41 family peptidase [Tessaracoccus caeni]
MSLGYRRFPHVLDDTVVFVSDDDIWAGPLAGGQAVRLTQGEMAPRSPRISPNGSQVAFVATTTGGHDLHVVGLDGAQRRLTWLSARRMLVAGWMDDEHVLLASDHHTMARNSQLYAVSLDGHLERLPYGLAMGAAFHPSGAVAVASPNFRDPAGWKRYRGGMAVRVWLSDDGATGWRRVQPEIEASLWHPAFVGDRLMFTSDHGDRPDVQAQVWSVDLTGGDLRQHTAHTVEDGYVRDATTDGRSIVYHARGRLYRMAGLDAQPEPIDLRTVLRRPASVVVEPTDRLERIAPDHGGNGSLLEWRGAAYFLTHRSGPARAVSDTAGVRIREPQVLGQTGRGIWASDVLGEDCLEIRSLTGEGGVRRLGKGRLGRVLELQASPDGAKVAIASHDGAVSVLDVADGSIAQVGRCDQGDASGLIFSPDARYLVWREPVGDETELGRLVGFDLAEERAFELTRGQFNDFSPAFSSDGRHLAFLSSRTIDPSYDELGFDLAFTNTIRPWIVPLSAEEPVPFGPAADGWPVAEPEDKSEKDGKADGADSEDKAAGDADAVVFDTDGVEDRMVALPVAAGRYHSLQAVNGGFLWLRTVRAPGVLGHGRSGPDDDTPDQVQYFSFSSRKTSTVVDACDSAAVSGDGKHLVVRNGDDVWVQPADTKPGEDDDSQVSVDLSRLRRESDPSAEWRQMFEENARLMRDHFWRADFDGVDWDAAVDRYRPLLDVITTHDELVDVLWETVAELNTSHAYVLPAGGAEAQPKVAFLGAEFTRNARREVVISRILPGESSDPTARSPLRAAGIAAIPGDVIVAVDGHPTDQVSDIGELLRGAADKVVELTLARGGKIRRVAVVPTASEASMRYHEWVSRNVAYVRDASAGRIGYVHVPDMAASGWAEFQRLIEQATRCEAVIVDVRYNGGGHTSELVIERIARKVIGWAGARDIAGALSYPRQGMRGPVAFVTNSYAGSDGDIVAAAAQELKLGPVIGERSWGGVVGIDGRYQLVDGTEVTQPRYWIHFAEHGWGLENHGVDPDIEVPLDPEDWESETDPQLDVAVAELLRALEQHPATTTPSFAPPRFSLG